MVVLIRMEIYANIHIFTKINDQLTNIFQILTSKFQCNFDALEANSVRDVRVAAARGTAGFRQPGLTGANVDQIDLPPIALSMPAT